MKDVADIVAEYLSANGYDGLYNDDDEECGCVLGNLSPIECLRETCKPGYINPCTCGGGCDFDIRPDKFEGTLPRHLTSSPGKGPDGERLK